jgi:class 3 adenylate cyclase
MASRGSSAPRPDRDRARVARLLKPHAPPDWETRFHKDKLLDSVIEGQPIEAFVMAADIRESTTLMKESLKLERFAQVMDKFVSSVRQGIRRSGGWFDKFTGDGFLAYWIVEDGPSEEYRQRSVQTTGDIAHTANVLIELFHRRVLEDFRNNSRNLSSGVGLSMGLDAGPAYLVEIADELTVVGPPVVGAVRMVTAAAPKEVIANVHLGRRLRDDQGGAYEALRVTVTREFRPTKEYPKGQEVYLLTFASDGPDREHLGEGSSQEVPVQSDEPDADRADRTS